MIQTAVEWLLSELQVRLLTIKSEPDGIVRETMINNFLIDTEQAQEMEKRQIIDFGNDYADQVMGGMNKRAEQYYNETFNK
jgi:hypothetical protein